jgi:predicted O-methyltransferase YrrM
MAKTIKHLIWLGAGTATEPSNLIAEAEKTTLIDARREACEWLKKTKANDLAQVHHKLVTPSKGSVNFKQFNLAEYSAINTPTGIKNLYPGLKQIANESIEGESVSDLIQSLGLEGTNNLLVVDILDINLPLLQALAEANFLPLFNQIYIQTSKIPAYESSVSTDAVAEFLQSQGYILQKINSSDPDFAWTKASRNPIWNKYKELQTKLSRAELATIENTDRFTKQIREKEEEIALIRKQLEQATSQITTQKQEIDKQRIEAEKWIAELQKYKGQLEQANNEIKKLVADQQLHKNIEKKLEELFASQNQELSKTTANIKNHINTSLSNTAKQIEAFMGIQNYLEHGIKPLSFHGWPISPDLGLYLTGLIDANNYDLIIEFGSGTSTVLMAKAIVAKHKGTATKLIGSGKNVQELSTGDLQQQDLPARIVTFEHNLEYYEKTLHALKANGVEHLVDVVHAPLIDYKYKDGTEYLYYSCEDKLQEISRIFKGRKANILVLVDGPPGATNKNARFPALPYIFNILPDHVFTFVIDDYVRDEEKEIVNLWINVLDDRQIKYSLEEIRCEKGCATIKFG